MWCTWQNLSNVRWWTKFLFSHSSCRQDSCSKAVGCSALFVRVLTTLSGRCRTVFWERILPAFLFFGPTLRLPKIDPINRNKYIFIYSFNNFYIYKYKEIHSFGKKYSDTSTVNFIPKGKCHLKILWLLRLVCWGAMVCVASDADVGFDKRS